jgi:hypothetical protein
MPDCSQRLRAVLGVTSCAVVQVATVRSSSPGDLEPVFATMLQNAVRICDAKFGSIYRWDDGALHLVSAVCFSVNGRTS